jgi:3-deoxy-D-manno-octulosonic-acid transferase
MYRLYGALLRLAWTVVLAYQTVIAPLFGGRRARLREKLGRPSGVHPGGVWLHAVSVGEVRLAMQVIEGLRTIHPRSSIHLTTGTETARAMALAARERGARGAPDSVSELPFDLPASMGRLLTRLRPRGVVIVETELWPNLLRTCGERGVPLVLVNGRISVRSFPRYRAVRPLFAAALSHVRMLGMQSEDDAARILALGAPLERIRVTGNLKYDLPSPRLEAGEARRRLGLPAGGALFVAGSTALGEHRAVLGAFLELRRLDPSIRLALAPRHPEILGRAAEGLVRAGLKVVRYSALAPGAAAPIAPYDALLVDVLGVLPEIYAAADIVFVGGSLVRRGGQNMVEAAALGKAVLLGPHLDNFRAVANDLIAAGAAYVARDGDELAVLAVRLLRDPAAARDAGRRGRQVVEANRGALSRTIQMIEEAVAAAPDASGSVAAV